MNVNSVLMSVVSLLALLALQAGEIAQEKSPAKTQVATAATPAGAAAPLGATDWLKNVIAVQAGDGSGTAVAVAPDTLYTAKHVVDRYTSVWVSIDGKWTEASVQLLPGQTDGAILKIKDQKLPTLTVRAPKYREKATIFAMRTRAKQHGLVASSRTISLDDAEDGVNFGDSGGAVIGEDGALIGVISGFEAANQSLRTEANRRVVMFTRAELFNLPSAAVASAVPQTQPQMQPNCPNGVCTPQAQQPQQFFYFRRK